MSIFWVKETNSQIEKKKKKNSIGKLNYKKIDLVSWDK